MKIPGPNVDQINGWEAWKPVSTIMRRNVPKVSAQCTHAALAAIFSGLSCDMALVVDTSGKPIGIVRRECLNPTAKNAAEAMRPIAFLLNESIPISLAAALMASAGAHEIPILSAAQDAVGVLTAVDVMTWVAHQAGHRVIDAGAGSKTDPNEARNR